MLLVILLNRCTRLAGCIRLRNDQYFVGWGVKPYSLTHALRVLIHACVEGKRVEGALPTLATHLP